MKNKPLLIMFSLVVMVLVATTQAQQQVRQPRSYRTANPLASILPLESSWSYICFELGIEDENLPKLRKIYQNAYNSRKELVENSKGDRNIMTSGIKDIKTKLEEELKKALTDEQWKEFNEWEKQSNISADPRMQLPPQLPPEAGIGPGQPFEDE